MPDFCRFCAKRLNLLDWFERVKVSQQYLNIIMFVSPTEYIDINDILLPETACGACYNEFEVIKAFYKKIKHSQILLKELYKRDQFQLSEIKSEDNCDTIILRENCVDDSVKEQEIVPTVIINSPPHAQNANLLTDNTIIMHKGQCITNCFVLLNRLELNPRGLEYSSPIEKENCKKNEPDKSILEENLTSTNNYFNDGHNVTDCYVIDTGIVKEAIDSDTETSTIMLCEGDTEYMNNQEETLIVGRTTCGKNVNNNVNDNSCIKKLLKIESTVSVKTTDNSWSNYKWVCSHCGTEFGDRRQLRTHSKIAHMICYGFKCTECDKQHNTFNSFIEHVRQHREVLRNFCEFCNQHFEDKNNFDKHVAKHTKGPKIPCDYCGQIFKKKSLLLQHVIKYKLPQREHKEDTSKKSHRFLKCVKTIKRHECNLCRKTYSHKSMLYAHIKTHNRNFFKGRTDKLFISDCCGKQFSSKLQLEKHVISKHNQCNNKHEFISCDEAKQNRFICDYCGTKIGSKSNLMRHIMRTHEKKKNFACNVCTKSFYCGYKLKRHLGTHDANQKKRSFTCNVCTKSFSYPHNLKRHLEIHDANRKKGSFTCNICSKSYRNSTGLKKHLLSHGINSKGVNYTCNVCSNSYYYPSCLKMHMKSHDVNRNYRKRSFKCNVCSKSYCYSYHLKKHMESHHVK